MQLDRAGNILDAVYRSILNVAGWTDVMANILAAVGSPAAAVVYWDKFKDETSFLYDVGLGDKVAPHDLKQQLFLRPGKQAQEFASSVLPAARDSNLLAPAWLDSLRLFSDETRFLYLVILRHDSTHAPEVQELLHFLRPHFERSIKLAFEIDAAKTVAALDQLAVASAIVDYRGVPGFVNRRMSELAEQSDGIILTRSAIVCSARRDNAALQAAMRRQFEATRTAQGRSVFSISRPSGRRSYSAVVSRVPRSASLIPPAPQVIVGVVDPDTTHRFKPDMLCELFGLTKSEAALCSALVETGSLANAAARCALTAGSARQYMKRIFAKTETSGQVDFVARVVSSVYGLQL